MKHFKTSAILAILFSLTAINATAESDSKVLWGLKASVDAELPGKWHADDVSVKMFKTGVGFTAGCVCNIYLGNNFYFEPGISLFYSQYRYDDLVTTGEDGYVTEKDPKLYKFGIQIPLMVGYSIDFTDTFYMDVYTGPQVRYAFAGEIALRNSILEDLDHDYDLWGINGQRRFDCSWKIGLGFPIGSSFSFFVEADLGITDLNKNKNLSFRENRLGAGLSYYF